MLYDHYETRIIKIAKILKGIFRHMKQIVAVASVVFVATVTLLALKGTVFEAAPCPDSVVYGDALGYEASAFLGDVEYEYRSADGGEWSQVPPRNVGSYEVRAYSTSTFGNVRYGEVQKYTIEPKAVVITIESDTVPYGEQIRLTGALVKGDSISCQSYMYADHTQAELWATGSATIKPDLGAVTILDENGNNMNGNYQLTAQAKTVTLVARPITLETSGAQKEYDGKELSLKEYKITDGSLVDGDLMEVVFDAAIIGVGTVPNEPSMTVMNARGEDVTALYDFTTSIGELTVTPRLLTVTTGNVSCVYDGQAHDNIDYTLDGTVADGETLKLVSAPSIRDVGSIENKLVFSVLNAADEDVTANYAITEAFGTLEVTPRKLMLKTPAYRWVYDDTVHSLKELKVLNVAADEGLAKDHTLLNSDWKSISEVGSIKNECAYRIVDADNKQVSLSNYDITVDFGTLSVAKRPLKISTDSESWVYDDEVHDRKDYRLTATGVDAGLVLGHSLKTANWASVVDVESVSNGFTYEILRTDGTSVDLENYEITENFGTLTVTKRPLKISTGSDSWVYNDEAHTCKDYELTATGEGTGLVLGHSFKAAAWTSVTDVACVDNGLEYEILRADGSSVDLENYEITENFGTLEVRKRPVSLSTNTQSWVYDGLRHAEKLYTISEENGDAGFLSKHKIVDEVWNELRNVGEAENTLTFAICDDNGLPVDLDNYDFTVTYGALSVTPRDVTVRSEDASFVYDGTFHEALGVTLTVGELAEGHVARAVTASQLETVGDCDNIITVEIYDSDNVPVTGNYNVSYEYGLLAVTQRPIKLVTGSAEKVYDDTPLTDARVLISFASQYGLVDGHSIRMDVFGTVTNAESVLNAFDEDTLCILGANDEDLTANYDVESITAGTLTVTQRPIKLITASAEKVYDGTPLTDARVLLSPLSKYLLVDGHTVKMTVRGTVTDAESVANTFDENTLCILGANGEDLMENYAVESITVGTLTVKPRPLTVTTGSGTWVYNDEDFSCPGYTLTSTGDGVGLVAGHRMDLTSGTDWLSVRDVDDGTVTNSFDFGIWDADGNPVDLTNYDINEVWGTLTVIPRPLTVTTGSGTWVYNDEDFSCPGYTLTPTGDGVGLVAGHQMDQDIDWLSVRNVDDGTVTNSFVCVILDANDTPVDLDNYDIKEVFGTLTVLPRPLTVTTGSGTWVYNDEDFSCPGYTLTPTGDGVGLVAGHRMDQDIDWLSVRNVDDGTVTNSFVCVILDANENPVDLENYDIKEAFGTLTVLPRPLTVTTGSGTWVYNDEDFSCPGYTLTPTGDGVGLVAGHRMDLISGTDWLSVRGVDDGTVTNSFDFEIWDANESPVDLDNYDIKEVWGTLTVVPRPLTITVGSKTQVYNGETASYQKYTVTPSEDGVGLVDGHWIYDYNWTSFEGVDRKTNTFEFGIYRAGENPQNGESLSGNYAIVVRTGVLEVTKRPLMIRTESKTWVYNDEDFSCLGYTLTPTAVGEGLVHGHYLDIDPLSWAYVHNAGTKTNAFSYTICDAYGENVIANYEIIEYFGTLTVTKRPLRIITGSMTWEYDGLWHDCPGYELRPTAIDIGLVEGHILLEPEWKKIKDVSEFEIKNDFEIKILRASEQGLENFERLEGNYEIDGQFGTLEITKRMLEMKSADGTWPYDAQTHKAGYAEIIAGSLPEEHSFIVKTATGIKDVGTLDNVLTLSFLDAQLKDVTSNFEITWTLGILEITESDYEPPSGDDEGEGGGGNSQEPDGSISDKETDEEKVLYQIYSEHDDLVYFKEKSFGDYNGSGNATWSNAPEYGELIAGVYPPSYLTALILQANGKSTHSMQITPAGNVNCILPYYAYDGNYNLPVSELYYGTVNQPYQVNYFDWDRDATVVIPDYLVEYERAYASFVRQNYLQIDWETDSLMQSIIATNGFDASDPDIIGKVARYIQESAMYNLKYPAALDSCPNQVVAFLTEYQEGVCRHYASAATMLYRALGIPARYTVGFMTPTVAGETVELTTIGHAWVEVYLDGLGWIPVEVTGGDTPVKPTLEIFAVNQITVGGNNTTLYAVDEIDRQADGIRQLLELGYTYEVSVSGKQVGLGWSESVIEEFKLFDPRGNDVTSQYHIIPVPGKLEIVQHVVKISLGRLQKYYDGTPLRYENEEGIDYELVELPAGYTLAEININISLTEGGVMTLHQINNNLDELITFRIMQGNRDVTHEFAMEVVALQGANADEYIPIRVDPRKITITAASGSKEYDESPLTNNTWYISEGTFVNGHSIRVTVQGEITEPGTAPNRITAWEILDADGKPDESLNDNYEIVEVSGVLTVTEKDA